MSAGICTDTSSTAQDIDDYLRELPIIQRFDDHANIIAGSDVNDAAAQIRAKLAEFNP